MGEVAIMGVEEEEDKRMEQIPSSLVLSWEEDQEAATVGGGGDKHQEKISLVQDSLGWTLCWEEGVTTVVTVTTIMEDTIVGTTMGITMGTTMDTTVEGVDTPVEEVDTTVQGVSVITDLYSKTSMEPHMVLVREGMRQVGDGATLLGMDVKMPGSHRGSPTTPGHT